MVMAAIGNRRMVQKARWRVRAALLVALVCPGLAAGSVRAGAEPAGARPTAVTRYAAVEEPTQASAVPATDTPSSALPAVRPAPAVGSGDALSYYRALIAKEAGALGLAPAIAEAVMAVESGFNPNVIGGAGEIGLMQIMPSTARMLGFAGSNAELASPEINIHYGVTYLAQAWRLAAGDLCTATMKYRAGHGETRFSYLSVNYCVAVRAKLAARGFPVSGSVPVATFGSPGGPSLAAGGGCRRRCLGGATIGQVDLAALNTKLNTLVMQVRAGR